MIKYRLATQEDFPQIKALGDKNGFPTVTLAVCFVAEEDGRIIGYVNGGLVNILESFVTENSIAGLRLFSMMEGVFKASNSYPTFAGIMNPEAGKELEKLGFDKINNTEFFIRR